MLGNRISEAVFLSIVENRLRRDVEFNKIKHFCRIFPSGVKFEAVEVRTNPPEAGNSPLYYEVRKKVLHRNDLDPNLLLSPHQV